MSPHFSFILSRGTFFYPLSLSIFLFQIQKKRREERGRRRRRFFFIYLPNFFQKGGEMNWMDAEEVLFISFFEGGKEKEQDLKNTKKTSFRLSTKQGLFIFYSISTSFLPMRKRIKKFTFGRIEGKWKGHSVTLH